MLHEISLWRGGTARSSLDRRPLVDYRGEPLATVHLAPAAMVSRAAAELRRAAPEPAELPAVHWRAIEKAGALLNEGAPGGLNRDDHARLITLATGAPLAGAREAVTELSTGLQRVREALRWQAPTGDPGTFSSRRVSLPFGKSFAWTPRGQVLGFVAPSNHPAVHLTWVLALAMGWTVLLRPGADDPFTPWRVLHALTDAGFPTDRIAVLSGGHETVPALVEACDLTVAYGGPSLERLIGSDRRVLFNGSGRSKVLVDGPAPPDTAVPFLLECIVHDGGRKCTCASSILVRGESPGLLNLLRGELRSLPLLDPLDPAARVPAWKGEPADLPAAWVQQDGLRFLQPDLVRCGHPSLPPFGVELPAPWATGAELTTGEDPLPYLRGSLAVTLLSRDHLLREACLMEPTIQKVFTGRIPPWHTEPGAPHHGRLSDFLFTAKFAPEGEIPWS